MLSCFFIFYMWCGCYIPCPDIQKYNVPFGYAGRQEPGSVPWWFTARGFEYLTVRELLYYFLPANSNGLTILSRLASRKSAHH